MRDAGFESALEEIVGNIADSSPVGTIPTALTRKGMHLKLQFLHNPLHRLMVDHIPKISHMRPKTPIPVIFVFFANGKDNLFSFVRYFGLSKFLLPIHIGRFGKTKNRKDVFQLKFSSEAADDPCFLLCIASCRRNLLNSFK